MGVRDRFTKEERSWIFYDWANSAYSIIIITAIFPLFYESIAPGEAYVPSLGFANSGASLLIAVLAPVLGTIADYRSTKKRLLSVFFALGVLTTLGLAFIAEGNWIGAIIVYVLSSVGFTGANLFYDSFLVDVTPRERMDRVSAAGFGFGYIGGSTIPFILTILMVVFHGQLGFASTDGAFRAGFILTALWWALFSIPLFKNVRQQYWVEPSPTPIRDSFKRLADTFKRIRAYRNIFIFLVAYFFYIEGVNTIIRMATPIATSMGIGQFALIGILLGIQITAFPFALLYGRLARFYSARRMIFVAIGIYTVVVFLAFFLPSVPSLVTRTVLFGVLALLVASSQGGIQALSRSYFAKYVPRENSGEFFGFYNIMGKFSSVVGPALVSLFTILGGGETRYGILSVLALFLVGGVLLSRTRRDEAGVEGAGDVSAG
jgi:UMF1 family MFS transporter